jgi:SAM-dependent methyltransferase
MLARSARSVVGGDIDSVLLDRARAHFATTIPLLRLSATALPLRAGSFDVVLFLEASYYVKDLERAIGEIARVLRTGGHVMFVNANPERPDFIRSPHSHHYHSADEFRRLLHDAGFDTATAAAFPLEETSSGMAGKVVGRIMSAARTALNALGLIPTTMAGRARLKRLLLRRLRPLPAELTDDFAPIAELTPVPAGPVRTYKVIYVTGQKRVGRA